MSLTARIISVILLIAILAIDRVYVVELASDASYKQINTSYKAEHDKSETQSPLVAFMTEVEGFIEAHEKTLIVFFTFAIAFFTATLWRETSGLLNSAQKQSVDMAKSVAEATRAANATEKIATATLDNATLVQRIMQKQMRAYLTVQIGNGVFQERTKEGLNKSLELWS